MNVFFGQNSQKTRKIYSRLIDELCYESNICKALKQTIKIRSLSEGLETILRDTTRSVSQRLLD